MIYGCPVWGLRLPLLLSDNIPHSVQRLLTTYRHLQRTLLHLTRDVRCEILTVITARPPLDILLRNIIWCYHHRLHSADPPHLISQLSSWTCTLDDEQDSTHYGLTQGSSYLEQYTGPTDIYNQYCKIATLSLRSSKRLHNTPFA